MAKAQSFADKVKKKADGPTTKVYRLVYPYQSAEKKTWRFADTFIKISSDADENKVIQEEIQKGRKFLESKV